MKSRPERKDNEEKDEGTEAVPEYCFPRKGRKNLP